MLEFEAMLKANMQPLERYVKYKISSKRDAEDVLQEVCLAAMMQRESLQNKSAFKAWLVGIASHKCSDYYRRKAKDIHVPLESVPETALGVGRLSIQEPSMVQDTLEALEDKERQILDLYFFQELSQQEISRRLCIPIGTVKSRLYHAKEKFKQHYPYPTASEGESVMKKIPVYLPEYTIEKLAAEPFEVVHEELPGMFVVPRMGESVAFGMYDLPERKQTGAYRLTVKGKVSLHGVEGVAIDRGYYEGTLTEESTVFAQLSDTHCKYLGGIFKEEDGSQRFITFLDNDFDEYFGIGEENCGFATHRKAEGKITMTGEGLSFPVGQDISDIAGRYQITINHRVFDTVRLIDYQNGEQGGMLCEYYLDKNGRTVLWRRFNQNNWGNQRSGKLWSEMLPENERLMVNGEIYVHWYDCITDILWREW